MTNAFIISELVKSFTDPELNWNTFISDLTINIFSSRSPMIEPLKKTFIDAAARTFDWDWTTKAVLRDAFKNVY